MGKNYYEVIIEGCDLIGKTYLAKELVERLNQLDIGKEFKIIYGHEPFKDDPTFDSINNELQSKEPNNDILKPLLIANRKAYQKYKNKLSKEVFKKEGRKIIFIQDRSYISNVVYNINKPINFDNVKNEFKIHEKYANIPDLIIWYICNSKLIPVIYNYSLNNRKNKMDTFDNLENIKVMNKVYGSVYNTFKYGLYDDPNNKIDFYNTNKKLVVKSNYRNKSKLKTFDDDKGPVNISLNLDRNDPRLESIRNNKNYGVILNYLDKNESNVDLLVKYIMTIFQYCKKK